MLKKWLTLGKKLDYQNPFMRVWQHQVRKSDGSLGIYYVLDRKKAGDYFSIITPLTDDLKTVLVGQYRYPVGYYSWEFPMGHAKGSSFLAVAKTELWEETGIKAKHWQSLGKFFVAPGHLNEAGEIFLATQLSFGKKTISNNDEILEWRILPLNKVEQMIKSGKILDGPTIVAYYKLTCFLKEHKL